MESSNRFADADDQPIDDCPIDQLMANTDKWSLKNDLELLSHLKRLSNTLVDKTEATNQSINSLVFSAKMHCVKVDNVINEFQMLSNSQFVENRVYDEEMEDIMTDGPTVGQNEEIVINKSKDEEILPKIKTALNIGLDFLNQRFDCVSKQVPQNDSDDENDQIVEGLISDSTRSQYSQRLLPYIIGSDDFIKDNYVGLNCVEESPAIDLKTRSDIEVQIGVKNIDNNVVDLKNNITNNFIDDISDSEEESGDIFSGFPQSVIPNEKHVSSDENDFDKSSDEDKNEENINQTTDDLIESKQKFNSFHDELSSAISAKNTNKPLNVSQKPETKANKNQTPIGLDSDSSDENESIFKVNKSVPKVEIKQKSNFSDLFGEEVNDKSLFDTKLEKQRTSDEVNQVLPNSKTISAKSLNLFEDEDEEEDDLFVGAFSKKVTKTTKPLVNKEKPKTLAQNVIKTNEKPMVRKDSLFDDDEEEDNLFSEMSLKSNRNKVQKSDEIKPIVKPTDSLIGELNSILKKKSLYRSDSEDSDDQSVDKSDDIFKSKVEFTKNSSKTESKKEINDSLFNENITSIEESVKDVKVDQILDSTEEENEFYSDKPTTTLSNDGLKHRAQLGSQRTRRPPTKRHLKMTSIIDFNDNPKPNSSTSTTEGLSAPIAAIRTVKPSNISTNNRDNSLPIEPNSESSTQQRFHSVTNFVKSPSTEEEDIFPTQTITKNPNISYLFEKSETTSGGIFKDLKDNDSVFVSTKTNSSNVDKTGLFDTSDSDSDIFLSNKSNVISNLIKPLNNDLFNDISSTDSSLSNKSDIKIENSKPTVSLFSDSDDDDLFSAVNKTKSMAKPTKKESIIETKKQMEKTIEKKEKSKNLSSLFSDSEEEKSVLFKKSEEINTKAKTSKSNVKPMFDFNDSDDDIFAPKQSNVKTSKPLISSKTKPKTETESSDLFDDPLFVSRS